MVVSVLQAGLGYLSCTPSWHWSQNDLLKWKEHESRKLTTLKFKCEWQWKKQTKRSEDCYKKRRLICVLLSRGRRWPFVHFEPKILIGCCKSDADSSRASFNETFCTNMLILFSREYILQKEYTDYSRGEYIGCTSWTRVIQEILSSLDMISLSTTEDSRNKRRKRMDDHRGGNIWLQYSHHEFKRNNGNILMSIKFPSYERN